jgi:transcriptional regulator with XRE-family HTH domain
MEVYEKINQILKNRNISKRWFARRLRDLEPKLKSTGEIPTEKTIYGYLNGTSNIKIELIPYIAEVLHIKEDELFSFNMCEKSSTDYLCVKEAMKLYQKSEDKEIQQLILLLPYAPKPLIHKLIKELEMIKKFSDNI